MRHSKKKYGGVQVSTLQNIKHQRLLEIKNTKKINYVHYLLSKILKK